MWNNTTVNQDSQYGNGVHLQNYLITILYDDIDEECGFIGNAGYITVKVFLENELILTFDKVENRELNPWLFIYCPVSC